MGNVASRPDEGATLYLRDQNRCELSDVPLYVASRLGPRAALLTSLAPVSISSLSISSPRRPSTVNITPSDFPATRINASRPEGDHSPLEFVQVRRVLTPTTPVSARGYMYPPKLTTLE